ncbi:hypothetical protein V6N13_073936 [Hibiscus sabdariffa]
MINDHSLQDHSWLKGLYKCREKWSTAFSIDIFSSQIKSSLRAEITNNVLHGISKATTALTKFIFEFENLVARWRSSEDEKDFQCTNGSVTCAVKGSEAEIVFRNQMIRFAYDLITKSQKNVETRQLCQKILYEGDMVVEKELSKLCVSRNYKFKENEINSRGVVRSKNVRRSIIEEISGDVGGIVKDCENQYTPILNPPCVRPKRVSNARLKESWDAVGILVVDALSPLVIFSLLLGGS